MLRSVGWSRLVVFISLFALFLAPVAFAATGFTNQQSLGYSGTSSSPSTYYQDGVSGKADVGIELCGFGQRFVGGFYAAQVGSTWSSIPVTYGSASETLSFTTTDTGGGCFATAAGFITVSPSELVTPNPDVKRAAFPGHLFIGYDSGSANPGTISEYESAGSNAELDGSYTATRQFDQSTRLVSVSTPTITFQPESGSSFSKAASDSTFGVSSDKPMLFAMCDDQVGVTCDDATILTSSSFPVSLDTGLSSGQVNDQNTFTKYLVINGLDYELCVGANLQGTVTSVSSDPVYYSQDQNVTVTISNPRDTPFETDGGNVDVTTNFDVLVEIYPQGSPSQTEFNTTFTVSTALAPSSSTQQTVTWPAFEQSGIYTVRVTADLDDDITECDETDNTDTLNFELKPITLPDVYIDGVLTNNFSAPNVPYNLTIHFENSDNSTLSNASVTMVQENGLNLFTPTQIFNRVIDGANNTIRDGLQSRHVTDFTSDFYGNVSMTIIPTYNSLYLAQYNYTDLDDYIGNYSLYFNGTQEDGEQFIFIINDQVLSNYEFNITNTSYTGPFSSKPIVNETIVSQTMDFIYYTFTNFLEAVVS